MAERTPFRQIGSSDPVSTAASEAASDAAARLAEALRNPRPLGDLIDTLANAGVAAERWTSPDLLGQLQHAVKRPVDTVLCNTLDFDDALPLQETIARAFAAEVVGGVALLAAATSARRAIVCFGAVTFEATRSG